MGQKLDKPGYFNSLPSAADYHADSSSGSNKRLSNPEYLAVVKARLDTFLLQNPGVRAADVPAELITASGSGLDPHRSPAGTLVQMARVAAARKLDGSRVRELVQQQIETNPIGPDRLNVLKLNLVFDVLTAKQLLLPKIIR